VFPNGLDDPTNNIVPQGISRKPSTASLAPSTSGSLSGLQAPRSTSFFGRWGGNKLAPSAPPSPTPSVTQLEDGPMEDLIMSGVAFGTCLTLLVRMLGLNADSIRIRRLQSYFLALASKGSERGRLLRVYARSQVGVKSTCFLRRS
jgi:hypothetical protein